jgi:hypothetical protein
VKKKHRENLWHRRYGYGYCAGRQFTTPYPYPCKTLLTPGTTYIPDVGEVGIDPEVPNKDTFYSNEVIDPRLWGECPAVGSRTMPHVASCRPWPAWAGHYTPIWLRYNWSPSFLHCLRLLNLLLLISGRWYRICRWFWYGEYTRVGREYGFMLCVFVSSSTVWLLMDVADLTDNEFTAYATRFLYTYWQLPVEI